MANPLYREKIKFYDNYGGCYSITYRILFNKEGKLIFLNNSKIFMPIEFFPWTIKCGNAIYYDKIRFGYCLGPIFDIKISNEENPELSVELPAVKVLNEQGKIEIVPHFRWLEIIDLGENDGLDSINEL